MIDLPDPSTFAALFADKRVYAAIAVSILAGAVRGFSGFGSALIYVPLISAIYDPRTAAGTFLLIDFATGLAMLPTIWRQANWREVLPLALAAAFAGQFGTLILQYTDPTALRWAIAGVVLVLLAVLMSGWRYHGRPMLIVTIAVGLMAGTLGSAVMIGFIHDQVDLFAYRAAQSHNAARNTPSNRPRHRPGKTAWSIALQRKRPSPQPLA